MVAEQVGHVDVMLDAVRHQHADDAVAAQSRDADRRGNGAVLAAGNAQDRVAAGAVVLEEIAYPLHAGFGYGFYVKHIIPPMSYGGQARLVPTER